jgi:hypothetical protein
LRCDAPPASGTRLKAADDEIRQHRNFAWNWRVPRSPQW